MELLCDDFRQHKVAEIQTREVDKQITQLGDLLSLPSSNFFPANNIEIAQLLGLAG
jgi:hypothetical protein